MTYFRRRWHMGRRDAALLLLGGIYQAIGFGFAYGDPPTITQRDGLDPMIRAVGFQHLGWVWVGCGLLAMVAALAFPPRWEGYGFGALMAPPLLWAGCYAVQTVALWDVKLVVPSGVYAAMSVLIGLIAGWPEPNGNGERDDGERSGG